MVKVGGGVKGCDHLRRTLFGTWTRRWLPAEIQPPGTQPNPSPTSPPPRKPLRRRFRKPATLAQAFATLDFPTLLLTDTAKLRHPNSGTPQDLPEPLDIVKFTEAVRGMGGMLESLAQ